MTAMRAAAIMAFSSALAAIAPGQNPQKVLHTFTPPPFGSAPYYGVIGGPGGVLYGTTISGGPKDMGAVYRWSAGGFTLLHGFTGPDGNAPMAGLARDSAGNLYGTTSLGGTAGCGVVFKIDTSANETVLHDFSCGSDGAIPEGPVLLDSAGNLYGTTSSGGSAGGGVVFKIDTSGNETVLHNFFVLPTDGNTPTGPLALDSAGNLYGTTVFGPGNDGVGLVYRLDSSGNETVLHAFSGGDGRTPQTGVILDPKGNLYGTTLIGGNSRCYYSGPGCGVVFKIDSTGNFSLLYQFHNPSGSNPNGLVLDAAGNLYGTTQNGAAGNAGVAFKLDPSGNRTTLFTFPGGPYVQGPMCSLILDPSGNLYGTMALGTNASTYFTLRTGYVFRVSPSGVMTVLGQFPGGPNGYSTTAGLLRDPAGNLYGSAPYGGKNGAGIIYELNSQGYTPLYEFTGGADGANPWGGLARDDAGNLYGATRFGGASGWGTVFMLNTAGNETVLYSFTGGADGAMPEGGIIRDGQGNLYGTTYSGGAYVAWGCVFKLSPSGTQTVLHSFQTSEGFSPATGVVRDAAGNLYGTTYAGPGQSGRGIVYKLDPAGNETILHKFLPNTGDGFAPYAGVVLDAKGNVYGTTAFGGVNNGGIVYKLDSTGHETVLFAFSSAAQGLGPEGGLALDKSGNLYGTTAFGGSNGAGTVFELNALGQETVLYNFTGGAAGANPQSSLIFGAAGRLLGTTFGGGTGTVGVVYEVTLP